MHNNEAVDRVTPTCFGSLAIGQRSRSRFVIIGLSLTTTSIKELAMQHSALSALRSAPHVIVIGNEKGGSGKTTLAMHVAIALLKAGQSVGIIDLDGNQQSLTRYLENRRIWAHHRRIDLEIPLHQHVPLALGASMDQIEVEELAAFEAATSALAGSNRFLIIDTPSTDNYLMRLAHLVADTLLTPLQDSFLDLCALGLTDPVTHEVIRTGHYAATVCEARKKRRQVDSTFLDWVVIRNRHSEEGLIKRGVSEVGSRVGFRDIEGCAERQVYRKFFPAGLTAFDSIDEAILGEPASAAHLAARQEMADMMAQLRLPLGERAIRRAGAGVEWYARRELPLEMDDIFADCPA
jgi:chromosome partitioning protein